MPNTAKIEKDCSIQDDDSKQNQTFKWPKIAPSQLFYALEERVLSERRVKKRKRPVAIVERRLSQRRKISSSSIG